MQDPGSNPVDATESVHLDDVGTAPSISSNNGSPARGRARIPASAPARPAYRPAGAPGVSIERRFTKPGVDVYETVQWERRDAVISNERGEIVFEQRGVEIPSTWTQLATNVVVSKYFRGHIGTPQRETSVRQLIRRVADTMADWGRNMDYFASEEDAKTFQDELTHILLYQQAAFNSPVWFNVGIVEKPQCSACFINSVNDTMESILTLAKTEGMLFKYGSGTGTNLSPIRGSREHLEGGGTASGPISFMRGFDQFAGAIKSGGKTRRAAKMVILNVDHPDIVDFITCKEKEEKKAWALIDAGYNGSFNVPGGAYDSVNFQNANHSVRVTDAFMRAYEENADWQTRHILDQSRAGTYKASELMRMIGESAWVCGDPGMQYDTTINKWHTCKNTDRIHASNPCVTGDTLVATDQGWQRIDSLVGKSARIIGADGMPHFVTEIFPTGTKQVYRLRTRAGYEVRITGNHQVLTTERGDVAVEDLHIGEHLSLQGPGFGRTALSESLGLAIGIAVGDGCLTRSVASGNLQEIVILTMAAEEASVLQKVAGEVNLQKRALRVANATGSGADVHVGYNGLRHSTSRLSFSSQPVVQLFKDFAVLDEGSDRKRFTSEVFNLDRASLAAVLRGLFTADGTVGNYGEKSQYVSLDSTSLELLQQVQLLLLSFGIKAKLYTERRSGASESMLPDSRGELRSYPVKEMHSLRISRSSRFVFEREIGFDPSSPKADALAQMNLAFGAYRDTLTDSIIAIEPLGEEPVYDLTEPITHHFVANGLVVHNCSEYMFLNDSACNLASINLMKFRKADGEFDVEGFKHACRILITAQEIIVDNASYPTPRIGENSRDYRPLGLGYANLGALLMARGLPYDGDSGRAYAAAITAIMTGEAYHQSSIIARDHGWTFPGYEKNRDPFLGVMRMHRAAVEDINPEFVPDDMLKAARSCWDEAIRSGEQHGYRNAQATVLAPTGTIGFLMDCDTTGVEPDIAIVKYKNLVGGGVMKIVNNTVPEALLRLGYTKPEADAIIDYIDKNDTIEGAPGLRADDLPVFDCAFKPANGSRSIHYMGHVRMMAAVQPFISGAISKTVNMPHEATIEEITGTYVEGWKLGLKAIAIYRDGSKRTQPLMTKRIEDKPAQAAAPEPKTVEVRRPMRRKLPDERASITHKFSIAGHEGYITVGMYEDGAPGEIFLTMSKEGSTISGLMDSFATAISLALQYGVPIQTLVDKFAHTRFEPSGVTNNPEVRFAKSIMDYIFRWLGTKFLKKLPENDQPSLSNGTHDETAQLAPVVAVETRGAGQAVSTEHERETFQNQADAPICTECGSLMVRNGACFKCRNCGSVFGCS
jgi:ribonucleoside-diphosphate reductase alpha chain